MRVLGFMHAKLDVTDMARSEWFYRDVLGLVQGARYRLAQGEIAQYLPIGSSSGVELWYESDREVAAPTRCHIAFQVDDVLAWASYLREIGVDVAEEPFDIGHERIMFLRDPDGYLIELNEQRAGGD